MGFDDLIRRANTVSMDRFGGEDFVVKLNGMTVDTIPGIFDEAVETVSPHDAETIVIRPAVTFLGSDFEGFGKAHTFTRDKTDAAYRIIGEPQADGAGMTILFLVKA